MNVEVLHPGHKVRIDGLTYAEFDVPEARSIVTEMGGLPGHRNLYLEGVSRCGCKITGPGWITVSPSGHIFQRASRSVRYISRTASRWRASQWYVIHDSTPALYRLYSRWLREEGNLCASSV